MPSSAARRLLLAALFGLTLTEAAARKAPPAETTVRLSATEGGPPQESFDCRGTIYAAVELPPAYGGKQSVEGLWVRPDGRLQERTALEMNFPEKGPNRTALWLKFAEEPRSILDAFSRGDGAGSAYHGRWTLKILCNGKPVAQAPFRVVCGE